MQIREKEVTTHPEFWGANFNYKNSGFIFLLSTSCQYNLRLEDTYK
jgi:hypothetical protein